MDAKGKELMPPQPARTQKEYVNGRKDTKFQRHTQGVQQVNNPLKWLI